MDILPLLGKIKYFFVFATTILISMSNHSQERGMSESPVDGVTFRFIEVNDIRMRIAESGDSGPLILFAHGWPES